MPKSSEQTEALPLYKSRSGVQTKGLTPSPTNHNHQEVGSAPFPCSHPLCAAWS